MSSLSGQNPGGVPEQLGRIFTQIGEAQTLDANGDELGAYRHYLANVSLTMQVLSADIQANQGQGTLPEQKVKQLFKMASHCLERGEDIFNTARKEQRPLSLFRLATPSPIASPTLSNPPIPSNSPLYHTISPSSSSAISSVNAPMTRSRASTFTGATGRSFPGPSNSHKMSHKTNTVSHNMGQAPLTSKASGGGGGTSVSTSSQGKAANWMTSKRAKLQGIPGLLGRKNGADSVDGAQKPSGIQRSGVCPPGQSSSGSGEGSKSMVQSQPQPNAIRAMSYRKEAELRNRHVMEQYKALLKKQHSPESLGTPISNEARLSMLRRLEENLGVARIREENIARRLKEKKMRDKEAGAKAKPAVSFISLSVDELCDHVTSFEHGKPQISALKARLNASDSDPSTVYSAISEIISIMDHPLSRLLGEYQYTIVMTLQPVVSAVEKAGGLPRVDIRLDRDRPSTDSSKSCSQHTGSRGGGGGNNVAVTNEDDDLLKFLGEDDDDIFSPADPPDRPATKRDAFDDKLERLKRELTQSSTTEDTRSETGAEAGNESFRSTYSNGGSAYENTGKSDPDLRVYQNTGESEPDSRVYQNTDSRVYQNRGKSDSDSRVYQNTEESLEDLELSNAPMFDSEPGNSATYDNTRTSDSNVSAEYNLYIDMAEPKFAVERNDSYGALPNMPSLNLYDVPRPNPRPLDEAARSIVKHDRNVYEDLDKISKLLQMNNISAAEGEDPHIYEALGNEWDNKGVPEGRGEDSVEGSSNGESHAYESTDGGMMSRQDEAPSKPEDIEMEKLVVFKSLPPLVGSAYTGDAVALGKLSDTAGAVLGEVVKQVQKSFKTLQQCFSSCYPILSSEDNQEVCHSVLEASFFPAIISLLTTVYRCKNYRDEVTIANNMCQNVNASPRDLAVRDKYWLIEQTYAPYGEAIDEIRHVTTYQYPSSKLECIVRMSKLVVKCIEEYCKQYYPDKKIDLVGVDDMLPIFSYVILRSGMPQLISECSIMEEFIQEGYIMGEEGFCLTSFLTALRYLINMSAQNY